MLTADTITDEQIRELRAAVLYDQTPFEASSDRESSELLTTIDVALYDVHSVGADDPRAKARARCAEILNARAAGGDTAETGFTAVAARQYGNPMYNVDLSGPIVLSVGYSACYGLSADGRPCCDPQRCRRDLQQDSPHLVNHSEAYVPTTICNENDRWATSTMKVGPSVDMYAPA